MNHRVKNSLSIINSIIDLETSQIDDPRVRDTLDTIQSRIFTVGLVHDKLSARPSSNDVSLSEYLHTVIHQIIDSHSTVEIDLELDLQSITLDSSRTVSIGLVVSELLINAIKYAFAENNYCNIKVSMEEISDTIRIRLADNGKSADINKLKARSGSIGMALIWGIVEQLGGTMEIKTTAGTEFEIRIPTQRPV